jgi:hypothetical protein
MKDRVLRLPSDVAHAIRDHVAMHLTDYFTNGPASLERFRKLIAFSNKSFIKEWLINALSVTVAYESGGQPFAINKTSNAFGLFQFLPIHSFYNDVRQNPSMSNQLEKNLQLWRNSNSLLIARMFQTFTQSEIIDSRNKPLTAQQLVYTALNYTKIKGLPKGNWDLHRSYTKVLDSMRVPLIIATQQQQTLVTAVLASTMIHQSGYTYKYYVRHIDNSSTRLANVFKRMTNIS